MFLGAGFLMPLGRTFGSWPGLLDKMIERAKATNASSQDEHERRVKELGRAKGVLDAATSGAKLQRVAQILEDTIGGEEMNKLGVDLLTLPPEVYATHDANGRPLTAAYLLSQEYAENTRIEGLTREVLVKELELRCFVGETSQEAVLKKALSEEMDLKGEADQEASSQKKDSPARALNEICAAVARTAARATKRGAAAASGSYATGADAGTGAAADAADERADKLSRDEFATLRTAIRAAANREDELSRDELVKLRKAVIDPAGLMAADVKHPSDGDKDKGKGIVQFRRRIAMLRLLPLKAIITT